MHRLFWVWVLSSAFTRAQSVEDAKECSKGAVDCREHKNLAAEVVERSQLLGGGMDLKGEVRTKIAVQAPLKMRPENSGYDQTILVCDGAEALYSGDSTAITVAKPK
jgi:hypothetical protein